MLTAHKISYTKTDGEHFGDDNQWKLGKNCPVAVNHLFAYVISNHCPNMAYKFRNYTQKLNEQQQHVQNYKNYNILK